MNGEIQYFPLIMGLAGGLAIFLFGMEQITDALKAVAGRGMKSLLARVTRNRFVGALTGAVVTGVIQSSSVTTVLVVGFVSAGLLTLVQSIGIIMGANIGSTVTAQILAFKVTQYSLVLIAVGFAAWFTAKSDRIRHYGAMFMGLGLIFLGMDFMSDATRPIRDYEPFLAAMRTVQNPLWGILIATVFTAIIQSSAATTGIVIVLASQGVITLEGGIALALGANIGTCATALLATVGKSREALQAAVAHIIFNIVGVLIWVGLIDPMADFVRMFSPAATNLEGAARLAAETPRQIANAHTFFNVANTVLLIGFVRPFAALVRWIVPLRPELDEEAPLIKPKYLNTDLIQTPDLAFVLVRLELMRLGARLMKMMRKSLPAVLDGDEQTLEQLRSKDDKIDILHGHIVAYLGRLAKEDLNDTQALLMHDYLSVANNLENIGDLIETELVEAGGKRLEYEVKVSEGTRQILEHVFEKVVWATETVLEGLKLSDAHPAIEVMDAKSDFSELIEQAEWHIQNRLTADAPNRLNSFRVADDIVEGLKRIYYHSKRIAKAIARIELDESGGKPVNPVREAVVSD